MKKWTKLLPLIAIVALLSVIYLLLPTKIVDTAYADNEKNRSTIAGVPVSGLDQEEIRQALQTAIDEWISQPIIVSGGGTEIEIDPSTFEFDIDSTISLYETMVDKPWYAFWQAEKVVHIPLEVMTNETVQQQVSSVGIFDGEETYSLVKTQVSFLKEHQIEAVIQDLNQFEDERIAILIEEIPENSKGISDIVNVLNNTVMNQGELFSYIERVGEKFNNANSTTLNFVASMIYSATLQTEFDIAERHQQQQLPTYIDPGHEASISLANNEDLKILNSSDLVAKLKLTIEGNSLKTEIYANGKGKVVSLRTIQDKIKPRIINRFSNDLAIGKQKLVQEGSEGLRIEIYRTISESGNVNETLISRDYYKPTNRIMLKSSRQPAENDQDLQVDLNNDGLPDIDEEGNNSDGLDDYQYIPEEDLPPGSYYDKAGNLITP